MQAFEKISQRIDSYRNDMVDLQVALCARPAIAPSSGGKGEAEKARILLDFLDKDSYQEVELIKVPDFDAPAGYRPNIIARYKGESSQKTIWILTHMDVVPPGELSLWKGNPFSAWVQEGRIYGRGVEDNQQDLVASLFAVRAFREEGILPAYDVGIVIVSDEETGNKKGIQALLGTHNIFSPRDLIIAPDAGNSDGTMIEVAEKSLLWLRIRTLGVQTHGSTPGKGINSLRAASHLIVELNDLYAEFNLRNPLFDPPISTFEPTMKEQNVPNINTIPGEDVFCMDCRILPEYDLERIRSAIRTKIEGLERRCGVRIIVEEVRVSPAALPTPPDAAVVHALQKGIKAVYDVNAQPIGIGGGTVASQFRDAGFEAACWSKNDETGHQPNEYCIIDNMVGDAKVFAHVFLQKG